MFPRLARDRHVEKNSFYIAQYPVRWTAQSASDSRDTSDACPGKRDMFHELKGHCIEFKYYADGIHSVLTPPGNNS